MYTLAETIRDGIRYTLRQEAWDTAALLRDYADCLPGVAEISSWEVYHGWQSLYLRDGASPVIDPNNAQHVTILSGYSQGDYVRIIHSGTLSDRDADLIHSLVFDGVAYAIAEKWTDTGFEVINSIGGLNLMDGPEQTLDYAIDEFLA